MTIKIEKLARINRQIEDLKIEYHKEAHRLLNKFDADLIKLGNKMQKKLEKLV